MKITSCGGQDVTYMGKIDMKIAFQVLWNEKKKAIEVSIKPVDTELSDVNVVGCKPPWYLWWVVVEIENIKFPFKSQLISPSPSLPPFLPVKKQFDGNQNTKKNKICSYLLLLQKGSLSEIQIYVYYHTIGMRVILICFYNSSFLILYFLINDAWQ